jgi:hypothetical protein
MSDSSTPSGPPVPASPTDPIPDEIGAFAPVPTRTRHDGWTPQRQHDFILALAASACVTEAAAAVGMSAKSAYRLRARPDASAFRQAWDIALDFAIKRLGEAALGRALNGTKRPIFYQGEQVGERIHYDERLTMFLLRYRDPVHYGAWRDGMEARRHPEGPAIVLAHALHAVMDAAHGYDPDAFDEGGAPDPNPDPDALPRALALGPALDQRAVDAAAAPDHLSPEAREFWIAFRAARRRQDEARARDGAEDDWADPLLAMRPRKGRNPRDVP